MKKNIISTVVAFILAVGMAVFVSYMPETVLKYDEYVGDKWKVGYGRKELTPTDWQEKEYYIAGFMSFPYNPMKENLDGIFVRAICLNDGSGNGTAAFATIDSVGMAYEDVLDIRNRLADFAERYNIYSIDVLTTHTHHAIDTQGLWGDILKFKTGMDPDYMERVKDGTVAAVKEAFFDMKVGDLTIAQIDGSPYIKDSREPKVYEKKLTRFRFSPDDGSRETYILNMGAHPENLGQNCSTMTSDYPYYVEKVVNEKGINLMFINGAIGGLIGCNRGSVGGENRVESMQNFGKKIGELICAITEKEETPVTPKLTIRTKITRIPITNSIMQMVFEKGITSNKALKVEGKDYKYEYDTEVNYLQLGDNIKVAVLPGEVFPELILGGMLNAEQAYNKVESEIIPFVELVGKDDIVLTFGMANDAIGYVVPDNDFVLNLTNKDHYEEMISLGGYSAPKIMSALKELVESK